MTLKRALEPIKKMQNVQSERNAAQGTQTITVNQEEALVRAIRGWKRKSPFTSQKRVLEHQSDAGFGVQSRPRHRAGTAGVGV